MAFKKYTQCYNYLSTGKKPFHIDDLFAIVLGAAGPGGIAAILSWAAGLWVVGAIAMAIGFISAIATVADLWLYQRLVCLTGMKCAVGVVNDDPHHGGLGNFDNDEFFNVILMPHRKADKIGGAGFTTAEQDAQPKNYIHKDGLMGQELLVSVTQSGNLPYDNTKEEAAALHCEAEGAFWVRMKEWAWVMGLVLGAASAAGAAAGLAVAGALCALGPWLCLLGILIGLLIWALSTAAGGAIAAGIMAIIFEASKGDVEDANVGDSALGPIVAGDKVIVYGEHVYDGFHEGWNEFHPLITVAKLNKDESSQYLEWDPNFPEGGIVPADTDDMPPDIITLHPKDMREGLNSEKFAKRATWMREKYCRMMHDAHNPNTRDQQGLEKHRWTIHPDVDGCRASDDPPPPR
ncbi:MAG TPA: hypothetical protein VI603_11460 [Saprospiraceae bacterium]|nr:hypothetical protein [Saprospiraceae bacterium]